MSINLPITLPCGAILNNRLAKAAMTERLSNKDYAPNEGHYNLYKTWSKSQPGLLITGNVMVDHRSMESAGNIAIEDESHIEKIKKWTASGTIGGNHLWAQLSHSGRQTSIFVNRHPVSPSDVKLKKLGFFAKPRSLTRKEIEGLITSFAKTASVCKKGGFTGIEIHAAHGYLINQFLSPITNKRTDQWGGSLENRARFLLETLKACRSATGNEFPIAVKINSADFQHGGFSEEESLQVIQWLENENVDLIEISGGTYEAPRFLVDENTRKSTQLRQAYFLDFAAKVRAISDVPLMITGGIRSRSFAESAVESGQLDVVGMARPFLLDNDFANKFLSGKIEDIDEPTVKIGIKKLADMAQAGFYNKQIQRLSAGKKPHLNLNPWHSALHLIYHEFSKSIGKW